MMRVISLLLFIIFCSAKCSDDGTSSSRANEEKKLNELYESIVSLSESVPCKDASEWYFIAYGSKACGGPQGYIAYSEKIDTTAFLELVSQHQAEEDAFNTKWNVVSDCSLPPRPKDVKCEEGEAVFEY